MNKSLGLLLLLCVLLSSCYSEEKESLQTYVETVNGRKPNLDFNLMEFYKVKDITGQDTIDIIKSALKQPVEFLIKESIDKKSEAIRGIDQQKDALKKLNLLATRSLNSRKYEDYREIMKGVRSAEKGITLGRELVKIIKEETFIYKQQQAIINRHKDNPNKKYGTLFKIKYSAINPQLKLVQENDGYFLYSKENKEGFLVAAPPSVSSSN